MTYRLKTGCLPFLSAGEGPSHVLAALPSGDDPLSSWKLSEEACKHNRLCTFGKKKIFAFGWFKVRIVDEEEDTTNCGFIFAFGRLG